MVEGRVWGRRNAEVWCARRQASLHVFCAFDGDLHDLRGIELAIAAFGGFDHCAGEVGEGLPREGLGAEGNRFAVVAPVTNALHNGNLRKYGHVEFFGQSGGAFAAENVVTVVGQLGTKPCFPRGPGWAH